MKKKLLSVILVIVALFTSATLLAAEEDDKYHMVGDILQAPSISAGDLLAVDPPIAYYERLNEYDGALISISESFQFSSLEVIVLGDCIEIGEVAIVYADGTIIHGIRETFSDGERVTLYPDPSKEGIKRERFISYKLVPGNEITLCRFVYNNTISSENLLAMPSDVADSNYPPAQRISDTSIRTILSSFDKDSGYICTKPESLPESPWATTPDYANPGQIAYSDVSANHWAFKSIYSCLDKGLMHGIGNNAFDPEGTLTRAQVAQICYNAYQSKLRETDKVTFADIPDNAWYTGATNWMAANSLITGTQNGDATYYYPNAIADRKYIALVLSRLADKLQVELPENHEPSIFSDITALDSNHQAAITKLQRAGIIDGFSDGTYRPDAALNRAQAAKLFDFFSSLDGLTAAE